MSLPRSDYDPRRVCVNPFPFLNKINLGKNRRALGVYLAGALVSLSRPSYSLITTDTLYFPVLLRPLDIFRCRYPLRPRAPTIQ